MVSKKITQTQKYACTIVSKVTKHTLKIIFLIKLY